MLTNKIKQLKLEIIDAILDYALSNTEQFTFDEYCAIIKIDNFHVEFWMANRVDNYHGFNIYAPTFLKIPTDNKELNNKRLLLAKKTFEWFDIKQKEIKLQKIKELEEKISQLKNS